MEFNVEDVYYLFIQIRDEKSVIKLQRDYEWSYEVVDGINNFSISFSILL